MTRMMRKMKPKREKLSPREEAFCREYLVDLVLTKAAVRAGYSAGMANHSSSKLMGRPLVQQRIAELMAERNARVEVRADDVLRELMEIAFRKLPEGADRDELWFGHEHNGKIKCLELLGKHAGLWREKIEVTGKDGGPVEMKGDDAEPKAEIARLLAELSARRSAESVPEGTESTGG